LSRSGIPGTEQKRLSAWPDVFGDLRGNTVIGSMNLPGYGTREAPTGAIGMVAETFSEGTKDKTGSTRKEMVLEGTEPVNRRIALGQKNLVVAWGKIIINIIIQFNHDINHPEGTLKTSSSSVNLSINQPIELVGLGCTILERTSSFNGLGLWIAWSRQVVHLVCLRALESWCSRNNHREKSHLGA